MESSQSGSVLQNEDGLDKAIAPSPKVPEQESQPSEEESIQIGDSVRDVITRFRGIVVGIDGERVVYECREWGQLTRHRDLVMEIRAELMLDLRSYIQERGWTQQQAAEIFGQTQPRISGT